MKIHISSLKLIIISCLIFTATSYLSAQNAPKAQKPPLKDRIYFGGSLGAQFGSYTYINVSPFAGYRATSWLSAGLGFTYMYFKDSRYSVEYSNSYYGPRVFAQVNIWQGLFAYAEYEALNIEYWDVGGRGWLNNLFLGGGFQQSIGGKAFASIMILYNLNDSYYSPYSNPVVRIGFGAGF